MKNLNLNIISFTHLLILFSLVFTSFNSFACDDTPTASIYNGYYSLSETDYDGLFAQLGIVHINCDSYKKKPLRYYNSMGQLVTEYTLGIVFIQYADGSTTAYYFKNKEQWDSKVLSQ